MYGKNIIVHTFYFLVYAALQVFLVRNLVLFDTAFCFVYVAFLLFLPFEMDSFLLLLLGFGTGLLVDVFYDTLGIHAAASVLLTFLRPYVIGVMTPRGGYELSMRLSLQGMGFNWFATYVLILTFIHHLALFAIEASQLNLIFFTVLKAVASTLFTCVVIVLIQYLFYSPKNRL